MLKHFSALILVLIAGFSAVNGQTPWTTGGNAPTSNCFIGTTTPTPLVMKTNGASRIEVDPSGIVKIVGLASADTAALLVMPNGTLVKSSDPGNGGDCGTLLWDGDGNASSPNCFIGTTNAVGFPIYTNGIERMRVTTDGNVVVQGVGARAAFQVYDHMGVTVNRLDLGVSDVYRSIGFNMYQTGATQYHYQLGTAAKIEYHSTAGLLQFTVAPSQSADAAATFPSGLQIDKLGTAGIGMLPSPGYVLSVAGNAKVTQSGNAANFVGISHDGMDGRVEAVGGASKINLVSPSGTANIQQTGNANNFVRMGHNGANGFLETGGSGNSKLQVNMQSAKTVQFGGDILVANHIGVGTTNFFEGNREYKLNVNGQIRAKAAHVYPSWADYVFQSDYKLMPLDSVQEFISQNGHLPGVPSAEEVSIDGIDLGEMQAKTLEKVEELTLYLLELKRENEELRQLVEQYISKDH